MMSITTIPQGWQCPGCKMIYSPTTTKCACQAGNVGVNLQDYLKQPGVIGGAGGGGAGYTPTNGWVYLNQNQGKNTL